MDADELEAATEEWIEAGIIDEAQAEAIREHQAGAGRERSLVVLALASMGAILVGIGSVWFLSELWSSIPILLRTVLLVVAPVALAGVGVGIREQRPTVGHTLAALGVFLAGPVLFLLVDLHGAGIDEAWLLTAWAGIGLLAGSGYPSRPMSVVGLLAALGAAMEAIDPVDPSLVVGPVGLLAFLVGIWVLADHHVGGTYRTAGVALGLGAVVISLLDARRYVRGSPEVDPALLALWAAVAVALVGVAVERSRTADPAGGRILDGLTWVLGVGGLLVLFAGSLALAGDARWREWAHLALFLPAFLGVLGTVALGYRWGSEPVVNVSIVALLGLVVAFLSTTVLAQVTGALALVVVGLALLAVGAVLERGRRELLARIGGA